MPIPEPARATAPVDLPASPAGRGSVDADLLDWLDRQRDPLPAGVRIIELHRRCLQAAGWPGIAPQDNTTADNIHDVWTWVLANHRYNSLLWNEEDLARRLKVEDSDIAANKRAIDRYNQARNDATERVDEWLLSTLGLVDPATIGCDSPVSTAAAGAQLRSETAGSIIDRLSILSLKVHAMRLQTARTDVDDQHLQASRERLQRLEQQRDDLARCLDELLADCRAGRAAFKVYRQFKMYNDPAFNPQLVAEAAGAR